MDVNQDEFGLPQQQEPNLPPPGDERREVLAKRKDNLEQQIDERSGQTFSIDPSKLEPDREILHDLDDDGLTPRKADPNYKYCWIQCRHPVDHPSRMVEQKLAEKVRLPNGDVIRPWQVVKGGDPDAAGFRISAENTVVIGDVLLMRCRKDHYALLELRKRRTAHERSFGTDSALVDLALSAGTEAGAAAYNKHFSNANQTLFGNEFQMRLDNALRTGTIPGMEINRR